MAKWKIVPKISAGKRFTCDAELRRIRVQVVTSHSLSCMISSFQQIRDGHTMAMSEALTNGRSEEFRCLNKELSSWMDEMKCQT